MTSPCHVVLCLVLATSGVLALSGAQKTALESIYDTLGGTSWTNNSNWKNSSVDACDWHGVTCDGTKSVVTELVLAENGLSGSLLNGMFDAFTGLKVLNLQRNALTGTITENTFAQNTALEELVVGENAFDGIFPEYLCNTAPNIRQIMAGLDATIVDNDRWYIDFTHVAVAKNQLTGELTDRLLNCTSLTHLDLRDSQVTGVLPESIGAHLIALEYLNLVNSQVSGVLPASLGSIPTLRSLLVHGSGIVSPFPTWVSSSTTLEKLWARVEGTIPSDIGNAVQLKELVFSESTGLVGSIPESLGLLAGLTYISFYACSLEGTIPDIWTNMSSLVALSIGENAFTGGLPSSLSSLTSVRILTLNSNRLSGSLSILNTMPSLMMCWVSNNDFTGDIPAITASVLLLQLSAANNRLSGTVPAALFKQRMFVSATPAKIDLSNNRFDAVEDLAVLGGAPQPLAELILANNNITSSVNYFCSFTGLMRLDASYNQFSGGIPDCLGSVASLTFFDFSHNELSGTVPNSLNALGNCEEIRLKNNTFSDVGPLLSREAAQGALVVLDLSYNQLTEVTLVLEALKYYTNLRILDLSNNQLAGNAQQVAFLQGTSSYLPVLEEFNMANNKLSGQPIASHSFQKKLRVVDYRNNQLDEIRSVYTALNMRVLVSGNPNAKFMDIAPGLGSAKLTDELTLPGDTLPNAMCHGMTTIFGHEFRADPQLVNYAGCECLTGYYGGIKETGSTGVDDSGAFYATHTFECIACLANAQCPGGANAPLVVPSGFYPVVKDERVQGLVECPPIGFGKTSCNPDDKEIFECAEGYKDRLCSACESGYFRSGGQCKQCSNSIKGSFYIFAVIVPVLFVAIVFWSARSVFMMTPDERVASLRSQRRLGLQTIVFYAQVLSAFMTIFVWPNPLPALDDLASVANLNMFGIECVEYQISSTNLFITSILLIPGVIVCGILSVLLHRMTYRVHKVPKRYSIDKAMYLTTLAINIVFFPLTRSVIDRTRCTSDPFTGDRFMRAEPYVSCDTAEHRRTRDLAYVAFAMFVIGVPVVFAGILYSHRGRLHRNKTQRRFGWMYLQFHGAHYGWMLTDIIRKFVITCVFTFSEPDSPVVPVLVVGILLVSAFFTARLSPFKSRFSNVSETLACLLLTATLLAGSVFTYYDNQNGSKELAVLVFLLNLFFGVTLILAMAFALFARVRRLLTPVMKACGLDKLGVWLGISGKDGNDGLVSRLSERLKRTSMGLSTAVSSLAPSRMSMLDGDDDAHSSNSVYAESAVSRQMQKYASKGRVAPEAYSIEDTDASSASENSVGSAALQREVDREVEMMRQQVAENFAAHAAAAERRNSTAEQPQSPVQMHLDEQHVVEREADESSSLLTAESMV
ncbi:MAG: hypothetical protein MHM6MM_004646 [Cercozoa sp. M6MM]